MIRAALPAFLVPDVAASVAYYRDVLGFHDALLVEGFAIVDVAPGQGIHFGADGGKPGRANRRDGGAAHDAYLRLSLADFERVLAGLIARGAKLAGPPRDQPWGLREVEVTDADGHVLCVSGGGAFPEGRAQIVPELIVDQLAASVAHYVAALGFAPVAPWGDPATVAAVERDGARLILRQAEGKVRPRSNRATASLWDACVECTGGGVDALAEEVRGRGAVILRGPETGEHGMRELEVVDPDGYVLCFSEDLQPDPDEDVGRLRG